MLEDVVVVVGVVGFVVCFVVNGLVVVGFSVVVIVIACFVVVVVVGFDVVVVDVDVTATGVEGLKVGNLLSPPTDDDVDAVVVVEVSILIIGVVNVLDKCDSSMMLLVGIKLSGIH